MSPSGVEVNEDIINLVTGKWYNLRYNNNSRHRNRLCVLQLCTICSIDRIKVYGLINLDTIIWPNKTLLSSIRS